MRISAAAIVSALLMGVADVPDRWVHQTKAYGDYFRHYLSQETIDRQMAQETSWNALFAGRYDLLPKLDRSNIWGLYQDCPTNGSVLIDNPLARIAVEADGFRVLAFNEDHQELRQRFFLLKNLELFWNAGYRHLGYETYSAGEAFADYDQLGHAGFYFHEPIMAATLRKAEALGFEVFGYESTEPVSGKAGWTEAVNIREAGQAKRVAAYIDEIPIGDKVLLWAGGDHITKHESREFDGHILTWMAARLARDHSIEPYTVDLKGCQFRAENEAASARAFMAPDGNWLVSKRWSEWIVNAQLHLPAIAEKDYSPGLYRKYIGAETPVPAPLRALADILFIQAFRPDQPETGTAYDSILMFEDETLPIYLPPGTFKLVAYGSDGTRLGDTLVSVE